ncbi:hypothetical protein N9W11_04325 [Psychrosphaera haliotis]|uniref:hypothetical protein n=1 Tax=Psychrosphaera haliotis TaxID=555083 RepID=UPI00236CF176|nr:hypothetical protein [Psychrosphaera haliotis]
MENFYLEISIIIALILNIIAGLQVLKSDYFEKNQKVAQIIIIFLIPFIASIGIILFLRGQERPFTTSNGKGGRGHSSIDVSTGD